MNANNTKKIPLLLKPLWFFGHLLTQISALHEGEIGPIKTGLIVYVLFARVFLAIPITFAMLYGWGGFLIVFFSFIRVNAMMYAATRVIKSIDKNMLETKKRARVRRVMIALFFMDITFFWVSVAYLVGQYFMY